MMKKLCILLLIALATTICGCGSDVSAEELQSRINELEQENENLKYECNILASERDYAFASTYLLNDLLEKRHGKNYLDEIMIYEKYNETLDSEFYYYYGDFVHDFSVEYALTADYYKLNSDFDHDTMKFSSPTNNFNDIIQTVEESERQNYDLDDWT